jgi:hypothetical protein
MSIIAQAGVSFRDFLQGALGTGSGSTVSLGDPSQVISPGVSLWLYQASLDEFSRNGAGPTFDPPSSPVGGGTVRRRALLPPLGVNLSFLVTPLHDDADKALEILDRLLLAIYESPLLIVRDIAKNIDERMRMVMISDNFEERHRLWDSLKDKSYRLSITCQLRTARLFSTKVVDDSAVLNLTSAREPDVERN